MYAMRLNEENYAPVAGIRRLNAFGVGQRVIYSGKTNYSYDEKKIASKKVGTIITKSAANVVIQLDEYMKPYRTNTGVDVLPPKQYAVVTESDLACGSKTMEAI